MLTIWMRSRNLIIENDHHLKEKECQTHLQAVSGYILWLPFSFCFFISVRLLCEHVFTTSQPCIHWQGQEACLGQHTLTSSTVKNDQMLSLTAERVWRISVIQKGWCLAFQPEDRWPNSMLSIPHSPAFFFFFNWNMITHWKDWWWGKLKTLATWCEEPAHWKKIPMLRKVEGKRRSRW